MDDDVKVAPRLCSENGRNAGGIQALLFSDGQQMVSTPDDDNRSKTEALAKHVQTLSAPAAQMFRSLSHDSYSLTNDPTIVDVLEALGYVEEAQSIRRKTREPGKANTNISTSQPLLIDASSSWNQTQKRSPEKTSPEKLTPNSNRNRVDKSSKENASCATSCAPSIHTSSTGQSADKRNEDSAFSFSFEGVSVGKDELSSQRSNEAVVSHDSVSGLRFLETSAKSFGFDPIDEPETTDEASTSTDTSCSSIGSAAFSISKDGRTTVDAESSVWPAHSGSHTEMAAGVAPLYQCRKVDWPQPSPICGEPHILSQDLWQAGIPSSSQKSFQSAINNNKSTVPYFKVASVELVEWPSNEPLEDDVMATSNDKIIVGEDNKLTSLSWTSDSGSASRKCNLSKMRKANSLASCSSEDQTTSKSIIFEATQSHSSQSTTRKVKEMRKKLFFDHNDTSLQLRRPTPIHANRFHSTKLPGPLTSKILQGQQGPSSLLTSSTKAANPLVSKQGSEVQERFNLSPQSTIKKQSLNHDKDKMKEWDQVTKTSNMNSGRVESVNSPSNSHVSTASSSVELYWNQQIACRSLEQMRKSSVGNTTADGENDGDDTLPKVVDEKLERLIYGDHNYGAHRASVFNGSETELSPRRTNKSTPERIGAKQPKISSRIQELQNQLGCRMDIRDFNTG